MNYLPYDLIFLCVKRNKVYTKEDQDLIVFLINTNNDSMQFLCFDQIFWVEKLFRTEFQIGLKSHVDLTFFKRIGILVFSSIKLFSVSIFIEPVKISVLNFKEIYNYITTHRKRGLAGLITNYILTDIVDKSAFKSFHL